MQRWFWGIACGTIAALLAPTGAAQAALSDTREGIARTADTRVIRGSARLMWLRLTGRPPADVPTTRVLPGDSLWSIAVRIYGTAAKIDWLRAANPGIEKKVLRTGMILRVPPANKAAPPERWADKTWQALQQKFGDDWVFVTRPLEGAPPDAVAKVTRGYAIAPDDEPTLATIHTAPTWAVKIRPPEPLEP
jgi:phage tail protein X